MEKELLETLVVAQVLTLARTLEAAGNMAKSDHYVGDAIREICDQRAAILQRLGQIR